MVSVVDLATARVLFGGSKGFSDQRLFGGRPWMQRHGGIRDLIDGSWRWENGMRWLASLGAFLGLETYSAFTAFRAASRCFGFQFFSAG